MLFDHRHHFVENFRRLKSVIRGGIDFAALLSFRACEVAKGERSGERGFAVFASKRHNGSADRSRAVRVRRVNLPDDRLLPVTKHELPPGMPAGGDAETFNEGDDALGA
ncbi:hypothetical protein M2321_000885 [Rhodoblastus acidophilus]|nr:hypothetical protein [Rhodoblastus acidophilus]